MDERTRQEIIRLEKAAQAARAYEEALRDELVKAARLIEAIDGLLRSLRKT